MEYFITHIMEPLVHKYGGIIFLFLWLIALAPVLLMYAGQRINTIKKQNIRNEAQSEKQRDEAR